MKDGWKYMKLGEVGTFVRGGNFSKNDFVENGFPCIHYGQIHMKFGVETFKHISSVPVEIVKPDRCVKKGDLVIAITSEDDAGSCKCTAWMGDYDVYAGGHIAIYRHTMHPKYVSYYFMSPFFQKDKLEFTHGFKVVEINPKDIAKISVPVPPLPEQQRIVEYLDTQFAKIDALKANAAQQLQAAKDLFQSALKDLMTPKDGWEWGCVGDFLNFRRGYDLTHAEMQDGTIPVAGSSGIIGYHNVATNISPCITVGRSGSVGKLNIYEKCWAHNTTLYVDDFKGNYPYFLAYLIQSLGIASYGGGSAVPTLNRNIIHPIKTAIPKYEEQIIIADTLDDLSNKIKALQSNYEQTITLCSDLKQSLLKQIFE